MFGYKLPNTIALIGVLLAILVISITISASYHAGYDAAWAEIKPVLEKDRRLMKEAAQALGKYDRLDYLMKDVEAALDELQNKATHKPNKPAQ